MPTPIRTHTELYNLAQARAMLRTSSLTNLSWTPGYMLDILTGIPAALAEEVQRIAVELNAKHFISQAEGDDLDTLALDHFGLLRNTGVSAVGTARFSRDDALFGNISISVGTIIETADGLQFVTITAPLMVGTEVDVPIAAVIPGSGGIVNADTIVVINPLSSLDDPSVSVTNPEGTAGGSPAETDAEFRARIIAWFVTIRKGIGEALVLGAKWNSSVKVASLDESIYPPVVYIADSTGSANAALVAATITELVNWRAGGIQVNVVGATVVEHGVDVSLVFEAGTDTSAVWDQVEAAVIAGISLLSIGETLYRSAIVAAALSVAGVLDCIVNDPAGDVEPAVNELIRPGAVSFS